MPPRDHDPARNHREGGPATARERERAALRRCHAAIAAAIESLRRAEQRFAEFSAAIDAHIERARAAAGDTGLARAEELRSSSTSPQRSRAEAAAAGARGASLSPVPSRVLP